VSRFFTRSQFDPESFVDGLLGIGAAGGKGGSSNEGTMLASRLAEMRQERELRAKTKQAREPVSVATAVPPMTGGAAPTKPNRPKNKKKKRNKAK